MKLQEVLNLAKQLSPVDKVRLIQELYQIRVGYPMRIFGLNIVETFHETSLQPRDITGVIVADLVLAPDIERELVYNQITPSKSLWRLCADLGNAPSAAEIDEARREEWANFPRKDI